MYEGTLWKRNVEQPVIKKASKIFIKKSEALLIFLILKLGITGFSFNLFNAY